jgi:hypothetical protein
MTHAEDLATRLEAILPQAVEATTSSGSPIAVVALVFHDQATDLEVWCCSAARQRALFEEQEHQPDPMHLWDAYQFDGWLPETEYRTIVAPVWDEVIAFALQREEEHPLEGDDREVARAVTTLAARALNARSEDPWADNLAPFAVTYPAGPAREPENRYLLEATITEEQRRRLETNGMLWSADWT